MKQREIKFKAWHKPTKKMFPIFSLCNDVVFEDTLDGVGTSPTLPAERKDCVILQYTGLKDCKGKEIYEGDILECKEEKRGAIQLGERGYVYWNNVGFVAVDMPPFDWDVMSPYFQLDACKMEVIGNIYENEGLLAVTA